MAALPPDRPGCSYCNVHRDALQHIGHASMAGAVGTPSLRDIALRTLVAELPQLDRLSGEKAALPALLRQLLAIPATLPNMLAIAGSPPLLAAHGIATLVWEHYIRSRRARHLASCASSPMRPV